MNKFKLFILFVCTFVCLSCSKADRLDGTTWRQNDADGAYYLEFYDRQAELSYRQSGYYTHTSLTKYTYSLKGSTAILEPYTYNKASLECRIGNSSMTVTNLSTGNFLGVYYKE
jgi:hypothetical protein